MVGSIDSKSCTTGLAYIYLSPLFPFLHPFYGKDPKIQVDIVRLREYSQEEYQAKMAEGSIRDGDKEPDDFGASYVGLR